MFDCCLLCKLPSTDGEVKIHAKEQQSAAESKAGETKPDAIDVKSNWLRRRGLERWLGELDQCSLLLLEIFDKIIAEAERDPDILNGLCMLRRIASRICDRTKPLATKYKDDKDWGGWRAHSLAKMLFFTEEHKGQMDTSYLVLETLHSLQVFLSYIKVSLRGMKPAAQALWDKDLIACVLESMTDVEEMEGWALQQMQVKAPQSLIVPVPVVDGKM